MNLLLLEAQCEISTVLYCTMTETNLHVIYMKFDENLEIVLISLSNLKSKVLKD
jgi:hypothetical protein